MSGELDIPHIQIIDRNPRHSYIIIGKPGSNGIYCIGSGSTTLALKLAAFVNAKYISPTTSIENRLADSDDKEVNNFLMKMLNGLFHGKIISNEIVQSLLKDEINLDESDFKGYVLEGLPTTLQDIELLKLAIEKQNQTPVIIQLHISDENLVRRRASQWVDPITFLTYSGQQVLYSRKRRHEVFSIKPRYLNILNKGVY
jgi:adenylate kinase family enzyme